MLRRALAAALCATGLGAALFGCPSRDLQVAITTDGASTLIFGCASFRGACSGPNACDRDQLLCERVAGVCQVRNKCELPDAPDWSPGDTMGMKLLLFQADEKGIALKKQSQCVPLNLRPCIPGAATGCPNAAPDINTCVADALGRAVEVGLGTGLTFDGFKNPDEAILAAAFFLKPGHEQSCDPSVLVGPDDCVSGNLIAAVGLASPPGTSTYDITCSSCQGSLHTSLGRDNEACPVTDTACFLEQVESELRAKE